MAELIIPEVSRVGSVEGDSLSDPQLWELDATHVRVGCSPDAGFDPASEADDCVAPVFSNRKVIPVIAGGERYSDDRLRFSSDMLPDWRGSITIVADCDELYGLRPICQYKLELAIGNSRRQKRK